MVRLNTPVRVMNLPHVPGYGRFHCELLTASALCILSAGFQNGLSGYVFPAAKCDLRLTSGDVGALNAAFLVGGACGSFVWGMMADTGGRKRALVASMAADVLVTAAFAVTVTGRSGLMVSERNMSAEADWKSVPDHHVSFMLIDL